MDGYRVEYYTNGSWRLWRVYALHTRACREADRIRREMGYRTRVEPEEGQL